MYEGNVLMVCKDIVEANWLDYLKFVKQQSDIELERQKKRIEVMKQIEDLGVEPSTSNLASVKEADYGHRYYDLSLQGFWNWYVGNKLED